MEHSDFNIQAWVGNGVSLGAIAVAFAGYIPAIAAGVALVWYLIQIFESATVQQWLRKRRQKKIAHLTAKLLYLRAEQTADAHQALLSHDDED